jgi:hypothetical protein
LERRAEAIKVNDFFYANSDAIVLQTNPGIDR